MHTFASRTPMRQRGFSVVELMVAMTLSLILVAGALSVLYSTKVSYQENERSARIQENGRAAFELLMRDLRGTGFPGCAQAVPDIVDFNNLLNGANTLLWNFGEVLQGFDAIEGGWEPEFDVALVPGAIPGNDVIALRTARSNAPVFRTTGPARANDDITVRKTANASLAVGQTVLMNDCNSMAVFRVSEFVDAGTTAVIRRFVGPPTADTTPTNATTDLGAAFEINAQVAPIATVVYYIRESASGSGPALWRVVTNVGEEEVIEGIEAMQFLYGRDTDDDRIVNDYVTAGFVADWNDVVNLRVAMLARSLEANSPEVDNRTYDLLGTQVGPFNDRFQRTLYTATVNLRNPTP